MMFLVFVLICLSVLSKRLLTPWQLDSHSVTLTVRSVDRFSKKMECLHQRIRVLESKIKSGNTSISQIPTNNEIRELQESVSIVKKIAYSLAARFTFRYFNGKIS
jgi:hypothetical protein